METVILSSRDRKFLDEVTRVIEIHLAEREFDVTELSQCLGKSRVTLHRMFRRILDQSASEFIRSARLEHAAVLLRNGEWTIHQVANQSGFYNLSYFSRCFKEKFGCRPSEYI